MWSTAPVPDPAKVEAREGAIPLGGRTLGALGWSYATVVSKTLLTLLVLVTLSRLLDPRDFGLFAIAWILVELAVRFGQAGIGHALIQRDELTDRHIEAGFTLSVITGGVIAAAVWLAAPLVGRLFDEPAVIQPLQTLAPAFVVAGAGVVSAHLLRRGLRFKQLMAADLVSYLAGYGLTATALAFRGFGVWALVWGELVRVLLYTAAVTLYAPPRLRPRLPARESAEILSPGVGLAVVQVFDFVVRMGGCFVVARWLGAAPLGYYTRADRLASLPFQYVSGSLFEVAFPAMARGQRRLDQLRLVHLHCMELLSLAATPLSVLMVVGATEVVAVVLGGQWDATVSVVEVLALAIPFQTCGVLNVAAVRATGAVRQETWRQAMHAVLVVLGAWFGSRWGLSGVAAAMVGAQVAAHLLMTQAALSLLGLRWRQLLQRWLPALWAGAWGALALWLAVGWLRALALPGVAALAAETVVWGAAVAAALVFTPSFARLRSLPWALANLPFDALGPPGRWLRSGLRRLPSSRGAD